MSYLETYKSRLQAYGTDFKDAQLEATKNIINKSFTNNPFYKSIKVDGVNVEAIVEQGKDITQRNVLFKPNTNYNLGNLVEIDVDKYLIIDCQEHPLYPSAIVQLCNSTLTFNGQPTQVDTGNTTDWGEPIYTTSPGQQYTYPCIVLSLSDLFTGKGTDDQINIVDSKMAIMIRNDNNSELKESVEFDMFGNHYRIYGFDRTKVIGDKGLLIVLADKH